MENKIVELQQVDKAYRMGRHEFLALKKVNLVIEKGEFCGLVGPSGSGKTTLLNIVGTLDTPTAGRAMVLNHGLENLTHRQAARLRSRYIGFIFQTFNLLPVYTVYENVEFPLLLLGRPEPERHKMVMEALESVHLLDKLDNRPAQLSGGESQRVAIARSIVKKPQLVLADEPTANLDAENSHHILRIMRELNSRYNITFLFSTHDEKVISYLRRKISLVDGRIVSDEHLRPEENHATASDL